MLASRHLLVLQAAMQFWDEEMSSHTPPMFRTYLDEPNDEEGLTNEDVFFVRQLLKECELRYALISNTATELMGNQLYKTLEEAESAHNENSDRIATLLVFDGND